MYIICIYFLHVWHLYWLIHMQKETLQLSIILTSNAKQFCHLKPHHRHAQVTRSQITSRFHYRSNLTDDPGNANFRSPILIHNIVATGFDVSTKDMIEKQGWAVETTPVLTSRLNRLKPARSICQKVVWVVDWKF